MPSRRRPLGRGAEGVLAARMRLIKLVVPKGIDGARAVLICDAIDMLERAAYRDGKFRADLDAAPPYQRVTAAELEAVRVCLAERDAELEPRTDAC